MMNLTNKARKQANDLGLLIHNIAYASLGGTREVNKEYLFIRYFDKIELVKVKYTPKGNICNIELDSMDKAKERGYKPISIYTEGIRFI